MLGSNLAWAYKDRYSVLGLYHRHRVRIPGVETAGVDLLDRSALQKCCQEFQPDILIHCAALANVDLCEQNKSEAEKINVGGTQNVTAGLAGLPTQLIYISTDSVFDGEKGNYTEMDLVHPINHYGWTKYQGEQAALQREGTLVLRTTIFGWNIQDKESLSEWVLHQLMQKERVTGFQDIFFSAIYTLELAKLMEILWQKKMSGLFHATSSTSLSKYDFAVKLAEVFHLDSAGIEPSFAEAAALKARRGKKNSLCTEKLEKVLGEKPPALEASIRKLYQDYQKGLPQKLRDCYVGME